MRRPLTPRQIEVFRCTIEAGTVSHAAERLGISQPAASKIISHMEQDSRLVLFERVRGRLQPTPSAMELYSQIEKLYQGLAGIELAIDAIHRTTREQLTVGIIPALADFMADVVLEFMRTNPEVVVTIEERPSQYLAEWIINRRVDLALTSLKVELPSMRSQSLIRRDLMCAIPRGHRLAEKEFITAEDFRDEKIVAYATPNLTLRAMTDMLESAGIEPRIAARATTAPMLCRLVAGGAGIAVVHPLGVGGLRDQLILRPLHPVIKAGYLLCWHEETHKNRLIQRFSEIVMASARSF